MFYMKKMTDEIIAECKELRAAGLTYQKVRDQINVKYPILNISRQSIQYAISPTIKKAARKVEKEYRRRKAAAIKKQYVESLKKLYANKTKKRKSN